MSLVIVLPWQRWLRGDIVAAVSIKTVFSTRMISVARLRKPESTYDALVLFFTPLDRLLTPSPLCLPLPQQGPRLPTEIRLLMRLPHRDYRPNASSKMAITPDVAILKPFGRALPVRFARNWSDIAESRYRIHTICCIKGFPPHLPVIHSKTGGMERWGAKGCVIGMEMTTGGGYQVG